MLDRKIRKKIEWAFRNYEALRTQAAEYLVELAESGLTARYDGVGGVSSGGNPTEVKGIKAAENKAVLWCKVVENTITAFRWDIEYELIKLHYFKKQSRVKVCHALGMSERTFAYWTDRLMNYAYQWTLEFKIS